MVEIEDQNNECYHINPQNVVYVKQRRDPMKGDRWWKITFVNGEQLHTKNEGGIQSIIAFIKARHK